MSVSIGKTAGIRDGKLWGKFLGICRYTHAWIRSRYHELRLIARVLDSAPFSSGSRGLIKSDG